MATSSTHTRTANGGNYGSGMGRWVTVQVLPPSNRRRNARGYTGAKPGWGQGGVSRTKRTKRQGNERMGNTPHVRLSRMGQFT